MFEHISKHLKICEKYSLARRSFNSPRCLEMWSAFVFDILLLVLRHMYRYQIASFSLYEKCNQNSNGTLANASCYFLQDVKVIGFAGGATAVFFLCFVVTCVVMRCRKAKRARHQASSESVSSSTALTPVQDPYPPPPEAHFQPNGVSSYAPSAALNYATPSTDVTTYISDPPPPYSYLAGSPPPYPGEERAPPYTPQDNVYQCQEENQESYPLVSAREELL